MNGFISGCIVGAFIGALITLIMSANFMLVVAQRNANTCIADGGTYEHCVNKYLMGKKQ